MPFASVIRWCLLPSLRRSTGLGPVLLAPKSARSEAESQTACEELEASGGAELGEEALVQCLEHACLLPFLEAPPAGHAGAVAKLLRQLLPGDPGSQHEQDAGRVRRSSSRLRPEWWKRRFLTGKSGSISLQSSSSSSAVAIEDLLVWRVDSR